MSCRGSVTAGWPLILAGLGLVAIVCMPALGVRAQEGASPHPQDQPLLSENQASEPPTAQAPDAPMGGGPGQGQPNRPEMERQRRHLEQLRLLKLLEVLDLKDTQEEPFLSIFRTLRKTQRDLDEQKGRLLAQLSEAIQAPTRDERKISVLIDSAFSTDEQRRAAVRTFVQKARGILTVEQIGKLLLFQERFEYELLERVREFRRMGGGRGPMRDQMDSN